MGASGKFQRFETGMSDQHQVGPRLVGIEADLLEPAPEALKIHLGQFFVHRYVQYRITLTRPVHNCHVAKVDGRNSHRSGDVSATIATERPRCAAQGGWSCHARHRITSHGLSANFAEESRFSEERIRFPHASKTNSETI